MKLIISATYGMKLKIYYASRQLPVLFVFMDGGEQARKNLWKRSFDGDQSSRLLRGGATRIPILQL